MMLIMSVYLICTLIVPGLLALAYSAKLKAWLWYEDCLYEDSTDVMVTGNDTFVEIERTFVE